MYLISPNKKGEAAAAVTANILQVLCSCYQWTCSHTSQKCHLFAKGRNAPESMHTAHFRRAATHLPKQRLPSNASIQTHESVGGQKGDWLDK